MIDNSVTCPTCGRAYDEGHPAPEASAVSVPKKGLLKPVLIGGAIGLSVGIVFVAFYFRAWYLLVETGTTAHFFHFMAIVHETAGTLLGLLGGLIYGALRRRA